MDNDELMREAEHMTATSQNPEQMADVVYSENGQRVIANNLLTEKALRRVLAIAKGEADQPDAEESAIEETAAEDEAAAAEPTESDAE